MNLINTHSVNGINNNSINSQFSTLNSQLQTVSSDEEIAINIQPRNTTEEILQNLSVLLATVKGTVVLDRRFGISGEYVDKPLPQYETLIISELHDAVAEYEPRVVIVSVKTEYDELKGSFRILLTCASPFFSELETEDYGAFGRLLDSNGIPLSDSAGNRLCV